MTVAIVDTGATGHYITSNLPYTNKQAANPPLQVHLPNGSIITLTHKATISIPHCDLDACEAHLFDELSTPLISVGQLTNNGCEALFTRDKVIISKGNNIVMQGVRNASTDYLWMINEEAITPTAQPTTTWLGTQSNSTASPTELLTSMQHSVFPHCQRFAMPSKKVS
jgi:hypothetical protein